mmetsp:Transcript_33266/g.76926  ORF Transcript_33266/g.76926 Transcript_33266/m.76926 type:complete len:95 (+) Transcript_33266:87-371(+)
MAALQANLKGLVRASPYLQRAEMFATIYSKLGMSLAREGMQLAPWAMPGVFAAGWFLFPAMKHAGAFDAFLPPAPTGTVYKFEREELGEPTVLA